mmetsp:Transcript_18839/g.48938  ORF Transcript_18839/g.48938 Transcript_18839/m.48938 type:complete len:641 (+) Transcript_18839:78-2000(+)
MPSVELRGWPSWAEYDDLKAVIEGAGQQPDDLRLLVDEADASKNVAVASFATAAAAGVVAAQLHGFEFTPGYPLQAKSVADPLPATAAPRPTSTPGEYKAMPMPAMPKGGGKGAAERIAMDEGVVTSGVEYPVSNCVGAGRIDGWFVHSKAQVEDRGWGHVQSFSFEGNLLCRLAYSRLLENKDFAPKDAMSFEVVVVADGKHQAVRMALASQEDVVQEEPGEGEAPWEDSASFEVEAFIAFNRKWLGSAGVSFVRTFTPAEQAHIIAMGPLTGVRDPCKVMSIRVQKAKEALGEIEPYEVRKAKKYPMSDVEWEAWNKGWHDGDNSGGGGASSSGDRKRHTRDETWGNEDGCGVFFGAVAPDVNEEALRAFAESVGNVKFIKLFTDHETGKSRGCGKVFYEAPEMAQRALEELHKVMFYGKPISCEVLGDETRRGKRQRPQDQQKREEGLDDGPVLLPLTYFTSEQTTQQKTELIYAVFEDLLVSHDAEATGKGLVWMVRSLFREINEIFNGNNDAKQAVIGRFKSHQWFWDNKQQVKWQASQQRINISKVSPTAPQWRERQAQQLGGGEPAGFVQSARRLDSSMSGVWDSVAPHRAEPVVAPDRYAPPSGKATGKGAMGGGKGGAKAGGWDNGGSWYE